MVCIIQKIKSIYFVGIILCLGFVFFGLSLAEAKEDRLSEVVQLNQHFQRLKAFSAELASVDQIEEKKLLALADAYKAKVASGQTSRSDLRRIKEKRKVFRAEKKKEQALIQEAEKIYSKCRSEFLKINQDYESGTVSRMDWIQQFNTRRGECVGELDKIVIQSEILRGRQEVVFPSALKAELKNFRSSAPKSGDINWGIYGVIIVLALGITISFGVFLKKQTQKSTIPSTPSIPTSPKPENEVSVLISPVSSSGNTETSSVENMPQQDGETRPPT